MSKGRKTPLLGLSAAIAFVAICLFAYLATRSQPPEMPPWYAIVPPLLAITLALVTGRIFVSLSAAVLAGGLLTLPGDGETWQSGPWRGSGVEYVAGSVGDGVNQLILLYVVFIMAMISVMLAGGGLQGVAAWLMRFARSVRSTRLAAFFAGLIIFIDDYANTMIVGSTLRPMTDRQRISREKLAFLVDATAAPIAGIAVISTWIGVEVGYLSGVAAELELNLDGYAMFFDALGFRFYCIGMIVFVFLNAFSGQDYGPMAKAERRAAELGKLLDDDARPMTSNALAAAEPHPLAKIYATTAIVPMAALLLTFLGGLFYSGGGWGMLAADPVALIRPSAWRDALQWSDTGSEQLLAAASNVGLLLAIVLSLGLGRIPLRALLRALLTGVRGGLFPVTVLILAWSLKSACGELQTGQFLANAVGGAISPWLFPAIVFAIAGLTAFATGTSWGTMGILIPIAVPIAFHLDGDLYGPITIISIAAVLDGAIFGDHCSPISDTTIMSSTAASCDHLAHVRTQMPYALTVAGIALGLGYVPAACGLSCWFGILAGAGVSGLLFLALWLLRSR